MTDEAKVADVLSGLLTLGEDLPDAKTREQKAMWAIDAKLAMDKAFELINEQVVEIHQARTKVEKLERKITNMSKYILRGRDHKRAYIKALKWYMANTSFGPDVIPEGVYITLRGIAMRMIQKAQRATQGVKS